MPNSNKYINNVKRIEKQLDIQIKYYKKEIVEWRWKIILITSMVLAFASFFIRYFEQSDLAGSVVMITIIIVPIMVGAIAFKGTLEFLKFLLSKLHIFFSKNKNKILKKKKSRKIFDLLSEIIEILLLFASIFVGILVIIKTFPVVVNILDSTLPEELSVEFKASSIFFMVLILLLVTLPLFNISKYYTNCKRYAESCMAIYNILENLLRDKSREAKKLNHDVIELYMELESAMRYDRTKIIKNILNELLEFEANFESVSILELF